MGRLLQVRLSASTYDIDALPKTWPSLCQIVWGEDVATKKLGSEPAGGRGVFDLIKALIVALEYENWPEAKKQALAPLIKSAHKKMEEMAVFLGDWDAKAANKASDELESIIDELEKVAQRFL